MKRIITLTAVFLLTATLVSVNFVQADEPSKDWNYYVQNADWHTFNKNLVQAINSDNEGLKVSAMQKVIKYADKVNVDKASMELVRLYRNNRDERVRQLALVTIHAIQNDWALGIVKRDLKFENSPKIKKLMIAVLNNNVDKIKEVELSLASF